MSEAGDRGEKVAELATELRSLVALRSRTSVRDRSLPALDEAIGSEGIDVEARFLDRRRAIDAAIGRIADAAHRSAAEALIGHGPLRWLPLTRRGAEAAGFFGLGWDGYRRRRSATGTSLLDETLQELALVLIPERSRRGEAPVDSTAEAPIADPPTGTGAPDPAPDGRGPIHDGASPRPAAIEIEADGRHGGRIEVDLDATAAPNPRQRSWARIALVAVAAVAIVGVGALAVGNGLGDRDGIDCGNLRHEFGRPVSEALGIERWAEPFAAAARELGIEGRTCPGPMLSDTRGYVYQEFSKGPGTPTEALVGSTTSADAVIHYDDREYWLLRSDSGINPSRTAGLPSHRIDLPDGQRMVLHASGAIYRESSEMPAIQVNGAMYREWVERGGLEGELGRPLSDAHDAGGDLGYVQSFAEGRLIRPYGKTAEMVVEPYEEADLHPGDLAGSVVRADGGKNRWWIDDDGVRHWVASSCTYSRIRTSQGLPERSAHEAAIAQLEAGEEVHFC